MSMVLFGSDYTIEVEKKVSSMPSLAIEDASTSYGDAFKLGFFKALFADMNVISIFTFTFIFVFFKNTFKFI